MSPSTPKGLATVALLKARFDQGRDHLGLFEPFVEDALRNGAPDNFIASDICDIVASRSGIVIPQNTMQALLARFARADHLERSGGRFVRTNKPFAGSSHDAAISALQQQQVELAEALREFADTHGLELSTEDSLAALAAFASENKVSLVLDGSALGEHKGASVLSHKQSRVVARFISQHCPQVPTLRAALEGLVEGLVLRDALLLSDLADLGARFHSLTVAIDTPVLLAALDLAGVANGIAAREFITLLQQTGARTIVFEPTKTEIRGILAMYEHKLATPSGKLSLWPNDMTSHILARRMAPSDMRTIAALLDRSFSQMGLSVVATPPHDARYTLDEVALANALVLPRDPDPDRPRIRHDVDCVAATLTLRRGRTDPRIERSISVFCSSTTQVVRNVQAWYVSQGGSGFPPMVHQIALSTIAWFKRPAVARGIKMHELAAVCAAVLRPQRATWDRFTETLKRLREDGTLTEDEAVAIVASELSEPVLAQLDEDFEPDADTILDAINRVRSAYRAEADEVARARIAEARAEVSVARDAAADAVISRSQIIQALERRVERIAALLANGFYGAVLLVLFAAAVLSVPGAFELVPSAVRWVARALVAASLVFGIISSARGLTLDELREAVQAGVAARVRQWLVGEAAAPSDRSSAQRQDARD